MEKEGGHALYENMKNGQHTPKRSRHAVVETFRQRKEKKHIYKLRNIPKLEGRNNPHQKDFSKKE